MNWIRQETVAALRRLSRRPLYAALILLLLGAGIGFNSLLFGLLEAVVLRPLPYQRPSELFVVWEKFIDTGGQFSVAIADYLDVQAERELFDCTAAFHSERISLAGVERPWVAHMGSSSPNLFGCLGVRPTVGRLAGTEDGESVILLSEKVWRTRFGGDRSILGRRLILLHGGRRDLVTVIGVVPRVLLPVGPIDLWRPHIFDAQERVDRDSRLLQVVARLSPDVTHKTAGARLEALGGRLREAYPESNSEFTFEMVPLAEELFGPVRGSLWLLQAASLLLLLIICANVGNLILVRLLERRRELGIRRALGAVPSRLSAELLMEPLILGLCSGALGLVLVYLGRSVASAVLPAETARLDADPFGWRVVLFSLAVTLVTVALAALPAIRSVSRGASATLARRGIGPDRHDRRLSHWLAAGQMALVIMLAVGAGLLVRSLQRLQAVDLGFDADGLLLVETPLDGARYSHPSAKKAFIKGLLEELRHLPQVQSASVTDNLTIGTTTGWPIEIAGRDGSIPVSGKSASEDFFLALGIPLLAGRFFNPADTDDAPGVVIVNRRLADRYWPGGHAIGQRIKFLREREIVGVVENVHTSGPEKAAPPEIYLPYLQQPVDPGGTVVVRPRKRSQELFGTIRGIVRRLDPEIPLTGRWLDDVVNETSAERRGHALAWSVLAGFALLLAALGVYGMVSRTVRRRVPEIGVRMAVGAGRAAIIREVFRRELPALLLGMAAGLVGAMALSDGLAHLVFGITTNDPLSFAAAVLVVGSAAVAAILVPAVRAAGVDPVTALRES